VSRTQNQIRQPTGDGSVLVPRTLLLSTRKYEQDVWRSGQAEFENVVDTVEHIDVLAPARSQQAPGFVLRQADRVTRRLLSVGLSYTPRIEPVQHTRDYELFCLYIQNLGDLLVLEAAPEWRKRCAKAVCFIEELWLRGLSRSGQRPLEHLANFDLILCGHHGTVAPLAKLVGRRCEWSPGAVDALRFFPGALPPRRTIDVFAMGRRSEISHRALLERATPAGWTYLFDTLEPRRVRGGDLMQHRTQLAELVKRSRYFLANRGRIDRVGDTGAQEELGFRSFEGAAGGAVLLGHVPNGDHVTAMFDWPDAHIHVPYDSTAMPDVIASLDREPERVARIRRDNVVNSLRRHDWVHRWRSALAWLDIAPTERLKQRVQQLEELAAFAERATSERPQTMSITAP
jgi:hypothetical protein